MGERVGTEVTRYQGSVGIHYDLYEKSGISLDCDGRFALILTPFKMNPFNSYTTNPKRLVGKVHRDYRISGNNSEPLEEILKL